MNQSWQAQACGRCGQQHVLGRLQHRQKLVWQWMLCQRGAVGQQSEQGVDQCKSSVEGTWGVVGCQQH
eukprot:5124961-Pleurochrysis_carterae.AAC.1